MPHKFSLAFLTLFDCGPLEAIRAAAESGYDMVGLRLLPAAPTEPPYPLMTDPSVLREAARTLKETGVAMADVEIARLKPETKAADFERFLEHSAELGARHVLVAGDDPEMARLTETFASFCRLARNYGLTADLEFMPWTKVPDASAARAIVEAAGETNGGVLIDALHFDRSKTTLDDIRHMPRRLVNYVQFCDGPADYDPSDEGLIHIARCARLMPGAGGIDMVGLARSIPDDVTISVEVPNHEMARTMAPAERARSALEATKRVLAAAGR
ncbi:TIM barrel protein [Aquamicrobium sp. LC103]|uniref:sugar phosphate isomerase/epimerase family protein n=1 Tax=Aquamicrobium sp. LC103 TaxID=1120658 RepID=UPI00063ED34A|nr:TIM barrel protein [Aquamicrobium sp. LC103]TKT76186.1 sugar phosphate isomerase/epimerase [Aquamicrobium sp. LC103]